MHYYLDTKTFTRYVYKEIIKIKHFIQVISKKKLNTNASVHLT